MENNRFSHFVKSQELKQKYIVNYLQNEINQTIISAKIKNDLIEKQVSKRTLVTRYSKEIKILLEKAFRDIYNLSSHIYPLPIDDIGFKYAVEDMCKTVMKNRKIQIQYEMNPDSLPYEVKIILYRVMEKTLGILKKKSTTVLLKIGFVKSSIVLKVSWNTVKGFRTKELGAIFFDLEEYILLLKGKLNSKLLLNRSILTTLKVPVKFKKMPIN